MQKLYAVYGRPAGSDQVELIATYRERTWAKYCLDEETYEHGLVGGYIKEIITEGGNDGKH